jgi:hypothetical protein
MTRNNLSFRLSASNPQHNPNSHTKRTPKPNRCLLGDLKPDTNRHQNTSLKHGSENINRLPTNEFFDHFDRLFKVKFVSPEKEEQAELEDIRVPTQQAEEEKKVEKLIDRHVESCTLGQQEPNKSINKELDHRFVHQMTHRAAFNRKLIRPNTNKHHTKSLWTVTK